MRHRGLALAAIAALTVSGLAPVAAAHATGAAATADGAGTSQPWRDASQPPDQRAHELLAAMTPSDKILMLHGIKPTLSPTPTDGYLPGIKRLGIPSLTMSDGPAGIRNHQPATALPAPVALASSWDAALAQTYGDLLGAEARDRGQDQVFAPAMNIDRVALGGRDFEYLSEDPLLSGTLAGAEVRGIQQHGVIATLKHYLANNTEAGRTTVSADIPDRALHEIYERNFGIAVARGDPGAVMCAYNRVDDVHNCSDRQTLDDLRRELGFDGYVVSDYPATHATSDLAAGLNVELELAKYTTPANVNAAVAAGTITQADVDQRVYETLYTMFRLGLFDRTRTTAPIDANAGASVARQIETRGAVLLKNAGEVLPLVATDRRIAIIGASAKTSPQGSGSSRVTPLTTDNAYAAIRARAGSAATVSYNAGSSPSAAATAARNADVAVVFVRDSEGEGVDRTTLALPGNQDAVITAVAAANPNTVVVLQTGGPVLLPWLSSVAGVVAAWYPGARGGAALSGLLFGDTDFSGHLTQTWPASDTQVPTATPAQYPGTGGEQQYSEGIDVGYRWYDDTGQTPLFPFGYGLSYTGFALSGLTVAPGGSPTDPVSATVDVTNTGSVAGTEVVQLYVGKPGTLEASPPRELGAFASVTLEPGETQAVPLTVPPSALSVWDTGSQGFVVQSGEYRISVGDSSRSLPLSADYTVGD